MLSTPELANNFNEDDIQSPPAVSYQEQCENSRCVSNELTPKPSCFSSLPNDIKTEILLLILRKASAEAEYTAQAELHQVQYCTEKLKKMAQLVTRKQGRAALQVDRVMQACALQAMKQHSRRLARRAEGLRNRKASLMAILLPHVGEIDESLLYRDLVGTDNGKYMALAETIHALSKVLIEKHELQRFIDTYGTAADLGDTETNFS
ncbi:MAG: hypothetical protein M1831_004024 [Alyxoria varia]|nr:MAG: hypothetical protein M1831_004024 [Alyxoria varia]